MTDSSQLLQSLTKKGTKQIPDFCQVNLPDGTTEEIARWHTWNPIMDKIYKNNLTRHFTSIMLIGGMGTGKTTLATFLAHQLHTRGNYVVKWLDKHDIREADTLFDNLPTTPHILIFDDVSGALQGVNADKKRKILQALTEIRHTKGQQNARNVIMIINVHYMMSFEKFWRAQGGYKFFTDIEREEILNVNGLTKNAYANKLESFLDICDQRDTGKFELAVAKNREPKEYITDKPFRLSCILSRKGLRFMLFYKAGCKLCEKENAHKHDQKEIDHDVLVDKFLAKYGRSALTIARQECVRRGLRECCSRTHWCAWVDFLALCSQYKVDWEKLATAVRKRSRVINDHTKKLYRKRLEPNNPKSPPLDQVEFINSVIEGTNQKLNHDKDSD